jgi:branched-subunit amino acid transport protein
MIESNYFWLNIFFLSLGTLVIRYSFIAFSSRMVISDRTKEIFSFIPSAVLPALIAPIVFLHKGQVEMLLGKERFVVLLLATVVCYLTRSTLATVAFGLGALYLLN